MLFFSGNGEPKPGKADEIEDEIEEMEVEVNRRYFDLSLFQHILQDQVRADIKQWCNQIHNKAGSAKNIKNVLKSFQKGT